ncbi:MAG: Spore protein SP21 [Syntrophorhabdaceae bacterium PtaU1.Bin034]|jgi:HSP20 family protein|nr:MAG: Spore protein SP21 [Syntrophorhabdaceae bacterium PtaU1.Bin034]
MPRKDVVTTQKGAGKAPVERGEWSHPFFAFRQEMDRLMEDFFDGFRTLPFGRRSDTFMPHVDVVDTEKEIKVSAELPGMDEGDIDVSLTGEALVIKGEKKEEKEEKGKDYYRSERSYGSFSRTIPLPVEVDTNKATATFKKGVLTVSLPKTRQAIEEAKKITVKTE